MRRRSFAAGASSRGRELATSEPRLSEELDRWLHSEGERTLGTLIEAVREKSFAVLFIVLLGVPALPLPTGGATHLLEAIAMLLALQLLIGRDEIWLPSRWRSLKFEGEKRERFIRRLITTIRWFEAWSRPRGRFLFGHRMTNVVFGVLAMGGTVAAFVAPPFSMLDTLPALGVVVLSLGVLLDDAVIVVAGVAVGAVGIALVLIVGRAAFRGIEDLAGFGAGPLICRAALQTPGWLQLRGLRHSEEARVATTRSADRRPRRPLSRSPTSGMPPGWVGSASMRASDVRLGVSRSLPPREAAVGPDDRRSELRFAGRMRRERQPNTAVTLAADVERRRIEQRATRMEAVVRELRLRARFHRERHGRVPAPLGHAIARFVLELRTLDHRLGELTPGPDAARARHPAAGAATPARR